MGKRRGAEYVAFDLETTGLTAGFDRVVEIGAVRFDAAGRELGRFESLVNPCRPMSPTAQAVHGISDADLAGAPTARVVLPAFLDFLGPPGSCLLLAHNAWFDAGFLGRELARAGLGPVDWSVVDTLALARARRPDLFSHRLDVLARVYGLNPDGPHRALADGLRVKGLWLALGGPSEPPGALVAYALPGGDVASDAPVGWDAVASAIAQGRRLRMEYAGGTRGARPREITPRAFVHRGGVAYLVALCHIDEYEKSFRLDRVRWYELVDEAAPGPDGR